MELRDLNGYELGSRTVTYEKRDAILYALAVGAPSDEIELVYERDLRVLPTYACALGLWAPQQAAMLGAYDPNRSLHAWQALEMHGSMPPSGAIGSKASIANVWDKGKAAMIDIVVESEIFTATYGIFLPDHGGWGGERGPSNSQTAEPPPSSWRGRFKTCYNQAAIYRLTGDLHPIHIDAKVARANGFERPILHGLCTLGIAARLVAAATGAHPADLRRLQGRFVAPVVPGDTIEVCGGTGPQGLMFEASVGGTAVLKGGRAIFDSFERTD